MSIVLWILFGLIIGILARWIMPGTQSLNWIVTILLGIVGAFVGGWIGSLLFSRDVAGTFGWYDIVMSVIGALIVLYVYGLISKKR